MRNMQEDFDKMVARLRDGRGRAIGATLVCKYRTGNTPSGVPCVVGCLIPDELYNPACEGTGINYNYLLHQTLGLTTSYDDEHIDFLCAMQALHDNSLSWDDDSLVLSEAGEKLLSRIATQYSLTL